MMKRNTYLAILLVTSWQVVATGQDPFGPPMPPAAPADPFAGEARPAEAARPADAAAAAAAPKEPDPLAIQLIRDSKPTTPAELLRAAQAVLQFGRADECKKYLTQLIAAAPADEMLAPLANQYADFLLRIARDEPVQPEGKQTSDLVLAAAQRRAQDPERLDAIIARLSAEELGQRLAALDELRAAGPHAVNPLLRVLADSSRAGEHHYVRAALARLGGATELPLIGALATTNENFKAEVILALGQMRSRRAMAQLVRPAVDANAPLAVREAATAALDRIIGAVPDLHEARVYLSQELARLLRGEVPYAVDVDGLVELWIWDEATREVTALKLPAHDAAVLLAAPVAEDLSALSPSDGAAERLSLLMKLEAGAADNGTRSVPTATGHSTRSVLATLGDALTQGRSAAALAAIEMLAQRGDASVLHTAGGAASPLAEAMLSPDRRVRLAAALAAVKLSGGGSFPGAGRVASVLAWYVNTSGAGVVLIGHPRGEEAQTLVGYLNMLGYEGRVAYLGRALAEEAFANSDVELVLVADAIDQPPVKALVQWLRRDYRTARLPIGIMARGEHSEAIQFALKDDPLTAVFPRLYSVEVAAAEIEKLKALAGRNHVGRQERLAQARAALAAWTNLAKSAAAFSQYELMRHEPVLIRALVNPALSAEAAAVLGIYGTPTAQTALVDFASLTTNPLADRQAAAAAFAAAVKSRGVLLTQVQIATQYDRTSASQRQDRPTQELLGAILDAIEGPSTK